MGNCCRSRAASNECGGAGTANSPADSSNDSDAHASNVDAESVAPADVAIGTVTLAVDSLLAVGEAVPVVGDFFELIANFKEQCMELLGRVDEANEVWNWAQDEVNLLKEIEKKLNRRADAGSNEPAEKALKRAAIKLKGCIEELKAEAKHISAGGSRARQLFRGTIHKRNFESAKEAVAEAKEGFNLALAVDTNDVAHQILEGQDAMHAAIGELKPMIEARHGSGDTITALIGGAAMIGVDDWRIRTVLVVATLANQGMLDLSPGFLNRATTVVKLRYSDACVAMFSPNQKNALVTALANVAGVAANCTHILNVRDGSLIIECSVDFGEDAIAAAEFADRMVCGQDATKDLSSLGLGDCRVVVAAEAGRRVRLFRAEREAPRRRINRAVSVRS